MGLRAATHFSDRSAGVNGHEAEIEYLRDYMTDEKDSTKKAESKDEVALELMRFIATTTGMGKTTGGAGFTGKTTKSPEEQVDALLQLYERCRAVVGK